MHFLWAGLAGNLDFPATAQVTTALSLLDCYAGMNILCRRSASSNFATFIHSI